MTLPVLMYHDISTHGNADFLTIPVAKLQQQLQYIQRQGYNTISLHQFHQHLANGIALPSKPLLITFDDGYKSNFDHLYPLLQQYNLKAGIFLVTEFVRQATLKGDGKYLATADLLQINPDHIDYGYHSFSHSSYGELTLEEIDTDLQKMKAGFKEMAIDVVPLFAYPFGASPRKDVGKMQQLQALFASQNIEGAFRIGNRINPLFINNKYQIQRIDVRGTDPFWKFKLMIRFGRKWLA